MACKKGWDREILMNNFTYKFVTQTYKRRREELLFDSSGASCLRPNLTWNSSCA